jgi:hypothetical protein
MGLSTKRNRGMRQVAEQGAALTDAKLAWSKRVFEADG